MPKKKRASEASEFIPSDDEDYVTEDEGPEDDEDEVYDEDDVIEELSPAKRARTTKSRNSKPSPQGRVSDVSSQNTIETRSNQRPTRQRKRDTSRPPTSNKRRESKPVVKKARMQTTPESKVSAQGSEAIALVNMAIAKLPRVEEVKYTEMETKGTGMAFAGRSSEIPELHGQKTIPDGHPECLFGKIFVISGVLDSLTREEAGAFIKRHGGRVTSAVSGKTTFLLVGHEAGQSKCEKARSLGTKFIDEDGLFQLVRAGDVMLFNEPVGEPSSAQNTPMDIDGDESDLPQEGNLYLRQELWVDKYKPNELTDLVGNAAAIGTLCDWLDNWREIHLFQETHVYSRPSRKKQSDDMGKKAVLISGSPGIGKTSAALLASKELGFDAIEVNASDSRNKADKKGKKGIDGKMANRLQVLCQNQSIDPSTDNRVVLIMDEVDGMSGGDRGGVTDLINNIKTSKIPIICICNDKYNRKLTSLRNHCMEVDFRKPVKSQVVKRLKEICLEEGLSFNTPTALEALVDQAHGDLRTLIGGLQFIRAKTATVTYKDIESGDVSVHRNQDISPFEATRQLLAPDGVFRSWRDRSNSVFNDMDLVPLLVQENYINHVPSGTRNESDRLKRMAKAASFISFGERLNAAVYTGQRWSLMPSVVDMGTLAPAAVMRGRRQTFHQYEPNFPRFTSYLGNLSSTNKQYRLLQSTTARMTSAIKFSIDRKAAALEYFPLLRSLLTRPLIENGSEAVADVCELMQHYCIDKECYDFIMDISQYKSDSDWSRDPLKDIPSKVKASLTRSVNSIGITCPHLMNTSKPISKSLKSEEAKEIIPLIKPDTGVIEEVLKEEAEEEEEVDDEKIVTDLKESGYSLKETQPTTRGKGETGGAKRSRSSKAGRGKTKKK